MKVIIAGSRSINSYFVVAGILDKVKLPIKEVVSGHAQGVDRFGERWADNNGIDVREFPADWDKWGKAAGPKRNRQMAEYADALILIWDGKSRGSKNMLEEATKRGLLIKEYIIKD